MGNNYGPGVDLKAGLVIHLPLDGPIVDLRTAGSLSVTAWIRPHAPAAYAAWEGLTMPRGRARA